MKEFLCKQFHGWYAEQICKQLHTKESQFVPVDLKLSTMKPLGAQWMIKLQDYLKTKLELLQNGSGRLGSQDAFHIHTIIMVNISYLHTITMVILFIVGNNDITPSLKHLTK